MRNNRLLDLLRETNALLEGHFLLTSGRHSNIYIEKFRVLENPSALNDVCKEMAKVVKNKNIDLVLGAAIGGILISAGVGRHLDVKHIFSERVNGKMKLRRGFNIKKGQKIIIVEDIITTGGSVLELIALAHSYKADIKQIINLVDRSSDGINFEVPSLALLNLPSKSWAPSNCPLCEKGIKITERGRSGKKMELV